MACPAEEELYARWARKKAAPDGRAAAGWEETLQAASDGRVSSCWCRMARTGRRTSAPSAAARNSPMGAARWRRTTLQEAETGLDLAVRQTLTHGGTVEVIGEEHRDLEPVGGLAALLRF